MAEKKITILYLSKSIDLQIDEAETVQIKFEGFSDKIRIFNANSGQLLTSILKFMDWPGETVYGQSPVSSGKASN